jgi:hypothetical protein
MSNGQEKQRFSARVKTETYQEANNLETRSNAIEVLVDEKLGEQKTPLQKALSAAAVVFVGFAGFMQVLAIASVVAPLLALNGALLFGSLAWFANYGAKRPFGDRDAQSSTQSAPMEVAD